MAKKEKKKNSKLRLHPKSKHRDRYDLKTLSQACPELGNYIVKNDYGDESIDFFNPEAVKLLNKSLLLHFYGLDSWDIPEGYLCPAVPGRADYIHYVAEMLGRANFGNIPRGESINCLDIGAGANAIYPIIGIAEYGWSFVGTEIDQKAYDNIVTLISQNDNLKGKLNVRLQKDKDHIFDNILTDEDYFDLTICNPPFHSSAKEAAEHSDRKLKNLSTEKLQSTPKNFSGQNNELWCEGGEKAFIKRMIEQSLNFKNNCYWFTSLVSKKTNLNEIYQLLETADPFEIQTINMGQGNKKSRVVAWTYLNESQQETWKKQRWKDSKYS